MYIYIYIRDLKPQGLQIECVIFSATSIKVHVKGVLLQLKTLSSKISPDITQNLTCTICPGRLDPIYIETNYIKWDKTSWKESRKESSSTLNILSAKKLASNKTLRYVHTR